jgi:hypothetical protein
MHPDEVQLDVLPRGEFALCDFHSWAMVARDDMAWA